MRRRLVLRSLPRLGLTLALLAATLPVLAQDKPPQQPAKEPPPKPGIGDDYRQYFKKPVTTTDFWKALQFELDVGRYDLAARHLHGLVTLPPVENELLAIQEKEGMSAFLKLRNIDWSDPKKDVPPKVAVQAQKDVEDLISLVSASVKKLVNDPDRIKKYTHNLTATVEERDYAIKELIRSGLTAIPYLVDEYLHADGDNRSAILYAISRFPTDTYAPLLPVLESDDHNAVIDLLDVIGKKRYKDAVPHLWYLIGNPRQDPGVRAKAAAVAASLLEIEKGQLPAPKTALTREAERYYKHQVTFTDPGAVTVWRWDGKGVVAGWPPDATTVPTSKAEEYWGLRYAREALDLDAAYQPAQVVFLSLALEKAMERAGYAQPLARADPQVHDLLSKVNPDLVGAVLDRALTDQHLPVIVASLRALAEAREVKPGAASSPAEPATVKALNYANRRVQMAAAEALLKSVPPAPPSAKEQPAKAPAGPEVEEPKKAGNGLPRARLVEVLRRAVAAEPAVGGAPKVLVAHGTGAVSNLIAKALKDAGFDSVVVATGRDALRRLNEAADIDAVIVDYAVPDPGLSALLAQLRADVNYGLLPVMVLLPLQTQESLLKERLDAQQELDEYTRLLPMRPDLLKQREDLDRNLTQLGQQLDRARGDRVQELKDRIADLEVKSAAVDKRLALVDPAREDRLRKRLREIAQESLGAPPDREDALKRVAERYRNVYVVPAALAGDADGLKKILPTLIVESVGPPLAEEELKEYADRSMLWLARMARGELPGFDVRPAADTALAALNAGKLSPEALSAAIDVAARLPGAKAQSELANVVLSPAKPVELRKKAAQELVRHVQQHGVALSAAQAKGVEEVVASKDTDPELRAAAVPIVGALRPDARSTGERLKDFQPPITPPAPPPPPPKDKDK
jgi:CheY-like chemotaxis protein